MVEQLEYILHIQKNSNEKYLAHGHMLIVTTSTCDKFLGLIRISDATCKITCPHTKYRCMEFRSHKQGSSNYCKRFINDYVRLFCV